jgi:hypothetical protein
LQNITVYIAKIQVGWGVAMGGAGVPDVGNRQTALLTWLVRVVYLEVKASAAKSAEALRRVGGSLVSCSFAAWCSSRYFNLPLPTA